MQSSKKKRYWSRMGCEARKLEGKVPFCARSVPFELEWSLLELDGNGGSGGGGDSGRCGDEGVAFSMRAQVK